MAKVIFHPNIQGYNGSIINKTHRFRGRIKTVRNLGVGGTVAKKSAYSPNDSLGNAKTWANYCTQEAMKIVIQKWYILRQPANTSAWETWVNAASSMSMTLDYNISAFQYFVGYFMQKYYYTIYPGFPNDISNGTSLDFDDRDSRVWS